MASLAVPFQFLPVFRYFTTKIAGEGCYCYLGGREFKTKSEDGKHFNLYYTDKSATSRKMWD